MMTSNVSEEWGDPEIYYEELYEKHLRYDWEEQSILGLQPCEAVADYLRKISNHINNLRMLDLGAGNGRHALEAGRLGIGVDAVERSPSACASIACLRGNYDILVTQDCITKIVIKKNYHSILCRDVLHFLPTKDHVRAILTKLMAATTVGGSNYITLLSDIRLENVCHKHRLIFSVAESRALFEQVYQNRFESVQISTQSVRLFTTPNDLKYQAERVIVVATDFKKAE